MKEFDSYLEILWEGATTDKNKIIAVAPPEGIESLQSVLDWAEIWIKEAFDVATPIVTSIKEIKTHGFIVPSKPPPNNPNKPELLPYGDLELNKPANT